MQAGTVVIENPCSAQPKLPPISTKYDRGKPNCTKCTRAMRKCQCYGLKLSWPRDNDRRRAKVSKMPATQSMVPPMGKLSNAHFVHTSNWDIELYQGLVESVPIKQLSLFEAPEYWNPSRLEVTDHDLLEHFFSSASSALATFGHEASILGNILVRIALEGQTASATALLKALLAFSSLHRDGLQPQALELKISALGKLAEGSSCPALGPKETIRHIATGMLLSSFEIHQSSCTSGQWTGYLGGVKRVIEACPMRELLNADPDVSILLDWVHYHDVLARFSLLYWRRTTAPDLPSTPKNITSPQTTRMPRPVLAVTSLLSEICEAVSSSAIQHDTDSYRGFLEVIDWRIRNLPIPQLTDQPSAEDETVLILQLYQLALLLYLNRSSEGLVDNPPRTQTIIDSAFAILPRLNSCKQQFPIHIIGCEARTDEQRAIVLGLIARTESTGSSRSYHYCKRILEASWAQDDLAYGNHVSYRDKMASIMHQAAITPAFV